jgi:hypothetical protein
MRWIGTSVSCKQLGRVDDVSLPCSTTLRLLSEKDSVRRVEMASPVRIVVRLTNAHPCIKTNRMVVA